MYAACDFYEKLGFERQEMFIIQDWGFDKEI